MLWCSPDGRFLKNTTTAAVCIIPALTTLRGRRSTPAPGAHGHRRFALRWKKSSVDCCGGCCTVKDTTLHRIIVIRCSLGEEGVLINVVLLYGGRLLEADLGKLKRVAPRLGSDGNGTFKMPLSVRTARLGEMALFSLGAKIRKRKGEGFFFRAESSGAFLGGRKKARGAGSWGFTFSVPPPFSCSGRDVSPRVVGGPEGALCVFSRGSPPWLWEGVMSPHRAVLRRGDWSMRRLLWWK